jgi:hypothetical protein
MGANKFTDDVPTLKFKDDLPTIKFYDDGGGGPTLKFSDDGGPTLKFSDDGGGPTLKFFDDGGPTLKFGDDPSLKGFDDVKHGSYDTLFETIQENQQTFAEGGGQTFAENTDPSQPWINVINPAFFTAQPFVLANPHHSMDWTKTFGDPNDPQVQMKEYEAYIAGLEQTKVQLKEQLGQLEEYTAKMNKELNDLKEKNKTKGK